VVFETTGDIAVLLTADEHQQLESWIVEGGKQHCVE